MKTQEWKATRIPSMEEIEAEFDRVKHRSRFETAVRGMIFSLLVVAAVAILIAILLFPFLRIQGTSMTPTLIDGEMVCCLKTDDFETGDIVAFYFDNKILVKRVIGQAGDWIDIDEDGTVYVNKVKLDEPYVNELAFGNCDISLPYQVPEDRIFVMGDHRETSADSRSKDIGCIAHEEVVGKIIFRVLPFSRIGLVE